MNKQYMGDGVYIELEYQYGIILTTENGVEITNRIVLEYEVLQNVKEYLEQHLIFTKAKE